MMQIIGTIVALLLILVVQPWVSRSRSMPGEAPTRAVPSLFANQVGEPPITPLVELTVCPEGPPVCQFAKIQEAIEAAPETPPVTTWQSPLKIPLLRIAPGIYEEKVVILKNIWLKGADQVLVRQPSPLQDPVTVFITGPYYLAVAFQNLTFEGEVQVVGSVSGVFLKNHFKADSKGHAGMRLKGELALNVIGNLFLDAPIVLYPVVPLSLQGSDDSAIIFANQFVGSGQEQKAAIAIHDSSRVSINANQIKGFSAGIELAGAKEIEIIMNTLEDNVEGIYSYFGSRDVKIRLNKFERHSEAALLLSRGSSGEGSSGEEYLVEDNQIIQNNRGIVWGSRAQLRIIGNTITQNEVGLELWSFLLSQDAAKSLENLKECRDNKVFENKTDYVILGASPDPLRHRCEGS